MIYTSTADSLRKAVQHRLLENKRRIVLDHPQILEKPTGSQGGGADFMKQLMGLSAEDKSTLQSRYSDVQLPEDCLRVFAAQELGKLHRGLDGIHDASRTHVPPKFGHNDPSLSGGGKYGPSAKSVIV